MGCVNSKPKPAQTSKNPVQPVESSMQYPKDQQPQKIDHQMIAEKQRYLHEQLDEGRTKPPNIAIPKIPSLH